MEHVTDITLPVNGTDESFRVSFHDDVYRFEPAAGSSAPTFSIRRHHSEWIPENVPDEAYGKMAIARLEKFLLSQH